MASRSSADEPGVGDVIELGEPNRDAVVVGRVARMEPSGLTLWVYLNDPAIHPRSTIKRPSKRSRR